MPMFPSAEVDVVKRARELFADDFGGQPSQVAAAPATYPLLGEYVDHYGGTALVGLAAPRAAVALRRVAGDTVSVAFHRTDGFTSRDSITQEKVSELAAAQAPGVDEQGRPTTPPPPPGGLAARVAGIVHTMIHRQLLSRDVAGLEVAVFSEIAPSGLGEAEAMDAAFALALQAQAPDLDEAPMRARLVEVCAQAADTFVPQPVLRARYTAALRGQAGHLAVVDYADGSVTQVAEPSSGHTLVFAAVPESNEVDRGERVRRAFLDEACRAFGATSLRALPDADTRVLDWLRAVHKVHPEQETPTIEQAAEWLRYFEAETERAQKASLLLRSRRSAELDTVLKASQRETARLTGASEHLVELLDARGAVFARGVGAGAAWALVPEARVENFAADLAVDGLLVTVVSGGEVARTA